MVKLSVIHLLLCNRVGRLCKQHMHRWWTMMQTLAFISLSLLLNNKRRKPKRPVGCICYKNVFGAHLFDDVLFQNTQLCVVCLCISVCLPVLQSPSNSVFFVFVFLWERCCGQRKMLGILWNAFSNNSHILPLKSPLLPSFPLYLSFLFHMQQIHTFTHLYSHCDSNVIHIVLWMINGIMY